MQSNDGLMVDTPLKIMHIASGDLWAGAEVQLFTLCDSLKNDFNHDVEVILLNKGELANRLHEIGILVHILDESELNIFKIIISAIKRLRSSNPDVVHTHRFKENIIGGLGAFFSGKIPSVRTCHGHNEFFPKWFQIHKRFLLTLEVVIGKYLQKKIVAVSQQLSVSLEKRYSNKKLIVIENGVNLKAIYPFVKKTDSKTQINEKPIYNIGIVGRLVKVKRVDKFIEFAEHWHKTTEIPCQFAVFGTGPLQQVLKEQAKNTICKDNILFYGHTEDIYSAISKLDVLVIISDHEGLPMTLLEAMAIGTPVLSVGVGGIPQVLDFGNCGTLVKNQSAESFTSNLEQLISNYKDTNQKTLNAQKRIAEHFSAKGNAAQFVELYHSIQKVDD